MVSFSIGCLSIPQRLRHRQNIRELGVAHPMLLHPAFHRLEELLLLVRVDGTVRMQPFPGTWVTGLVSRTRLLRLNPLANGLGHGSHARASARPPPDPGS